MARFEEIIPEEEEETLEDLLEGNKSYPDLTPTDKVTFSIPKGMSKKAFLKAIEGLSQPQKPRRREYPGCDTCAHLAPPPVYCKFYSSTCATQVLNGQMPYRYDPQEV